MTPAALHDALLAHLLARVDAHEHRSRASDKPALLTALRARGWRFSPATKGAPAARSCSDLQLVQAYAAGDSEAFDLLFERYHGQLLGYARRWGPDAEDLVNEAFIALLRPEPPRNVRAYLFTVLRNRACSRELAREREPLLSEAPPEQPDPSGDLLSALLAHHARVRVLDALEDDCSAAEQAVLLCDHRGSTNAETAVELGVSRNRVAVIRFRARAKLRAALNETLS